MDRRGTRRQRRHRRRVHQRVFAGGAAVVALGAVLAVVALGLLNGRHHAAAAKQRAELAATGTSTTTALPATTTTTFPPHPSVALRVDHVVTTDPVVFITIDDGWHPLPDVLAFLQSHQAPVTAFLIAPIAQRDADFYRQVLQLGGTVEDHTMHHPDLGRLPLGQEASELCQAADLDLATFGRRPVLARPPYGSENQYTDPAVAYCGMYDTVLWDAKFSDHQFSLAHPGGLRAGDIVLMHWGPGLLQDLQTLFPIIQAAGLHPAPLQDYIGPTATHTGTVPSGPTGNVSE